MRLILRSIGMALALACMPLAYAAGSCNPVTSDEALKAEDAR